MKIIKFTKWKSVKESIAFTKGGRVKKIANCSV